MPPRGRKDRTMTQELKRKIGQMLMAGFPSPQVDEQARKLVHDFCLGNFVLFKRNFENSRQTGEMCEGLNALTYEDSGLAPIISLDQEGGNISRMVEGASLLPGAMSVSAADANGFEIGSICARVMTSHGVNANLAPVLDVNSDPMNPIIGFRSFGDTPETVIKYGVSELKGMNAGGMLATMKHFPGHGNVSGDSHLTLPVNNSDEATLRAVDFAPFKAAVEAGAEALMTCHVVFKDFDPDNPATLSRRIMTDYLRGELGFQGIVMTDCMEMGAIRDTIGTGEGAVRAVEAGCDMLCISHTYEAVSAAANALYAAVDSGRLSPERIEESYQRILRVKRKFGLDKPFVFDAAKGEAAIHNEADIRALRAVSRRGITRVYDDFKAPDLSNPVFLSPNALCFTGNDNPEGMPDNFAYSAAKRLGGKSIIFPIDTVDDATKEAIDAARGSAFVLGLYNARFRPSQIEVYKLLKQKQVPVTVVLLGAPYDLGLLAGERNVIVSYEYTDASIKAVLNALTENAYYGRLPVRL